ncbi:MAG TPA: J domain-containing protein [Candidatus Sulfotelmatobacter sp.]|nr:J domain-containing protein [Candidatus Sulfotelmatobacter sp.]
MSTLYDTLGVPTTAKADQIRSTYRVLVKGFHPDLFPSGSVEQYQAGELLRRIISAYAVLSNPHKRSAYDAKLAKQEAALEPEHCGRCGRPTLYWQIGREIPLCSDCKPTVR